MTRTPAPRARAATYTPVMGTVLEIAVLPPESSAAVERIVLDEIARLSTVLSGHDETSELCRWRRGEVERTSADLAAVLDAARYWHAASGGAFHPATGVLRRAWAEATRAGRLPADRDLRRLAEAHAELPFRTRRMGTGPAGIVVERTGDCSAVDVDALAKGYVVDAAVEAVRVTGVLGPDGQVTVNAGGDLRHAGAGSRLVRIENPLRPFDNAPPMTSVPVRNAALATSGTARRGYGVDGRRLGHILDPRTGWPAQHAASVSVLAPDTMTADAVSTAAMVVAGDRAFELVEELGLACLLVAPSGAVQASTRWPATHSGWMEAGE